MISLPTILSSIAVIVGIINLANLLISQKFNKESLIKIQGNELVHVDLDLKEIKTDIKDLNCTVGKLGERISSLEGKVGK